MKIYSSCNLMKSYSVKFEDTVADFLASDFSNNQLINQLIIERNVIKEQELLLLDPTRNRVPQELSELNRQRIFLEKRITNLIDEERFTRRSEYREISNRTTFPPT